MAFQGLAGLLKLHARQDYRQASGSGTALASNAADNSARFANGGETGKDKEVRSAWGIHGNGLFLFGLAAAMVNAA
jgi:hypothetical protein